MINRPNPAKLQRICIVKLSAIGDVVHALPTAAAIKRTWPHIDIWWLVEDRCAGILEDNPTLTGVITVPLKRWRKDPWSARTWRELAAFRRTLRAHRFDLVIDIQGLLKSAILAMMTGCRMRISHADQREGSRFLNKAVPAYSKGTHVVDEYLDVARFLGAEPFPVEFPLHVPDKARDRIHQLMNEYGLADGSPLAVINPSAGQPQKRWPADRFAELAHRLETERQMRVAVVGAASDKELAQHVCTGNHAVNLAGLTTLKELAALLERATVHICGDTGSAHIASALGTPVVGLYGPTNPRRSCPYGQLERVVSTYGTCPDCAAHPRCKSDLCMVTMATEDVFQAVDRVLAEVYAHE